MQKSVVFLRCTNFCFFTWMWWSMGVMVFCKGAQKLAVGENKTLTGQVMYLLLPPSQWLFESGWVDLTLVKLPSLFTIVSLCLIVQLSFILTNLSFSYFHICLLFVILSKFWFSFLSLLKKTQWLAQKTCIQHAQAVKLCLSGLILLQKESSNMNTVLRVLNPFLFIYLFKIKTTLTFWRRTKNQSVEYLLQFSHSVFSWLWGKSLDIHLLLLLCFLSLCVGVCGSMHTWGF